MEKTGKKSSASCPYEPPHTPNKFERDGRKQKANNNPANYGFIGGFIGENNTSSPMKNNQEKVPES